MKKTIALLLTISFVFALMMPISSADNITYPPTTTSVLSGPDASKVFTGVCGQSEDGTSISFLPETGKYNACLRWMESSVGENKYVVFETDFAPPVLNHIALRTQSNSFVTPEITSGWLTGRWNTLRLVYEAPTSDYVNGRTAVYINGNTVLELTQNSTALVDNDFRLCFNFPSSQSTYTPLYAKNYSMYYSETNPGADGIGCTATLTNGNITFDGNKIVVGQNLAVSELTASDSAEIRVYRDSSFASKLTDDDVLSIGNVVVIQKDGKLRYFDVEKEGKRVIYDKNTQPAWGMTNIDTAKTKSVTGYLGKDDDDSSTVYTGSANVSNINFTYSGEHHRYVVAKWNIYVQKLSDLVNLQVQSNSGAPSMVVPGNLLAENVWNNVILVIDTQEKESKVYLNGELCEGCGISANQFLTSGSYTAFRIRCEGTSPITFAVDDFQMSTCEDTPETEVKPSLSCCVKNSAFINSDTTVESLADNTYDIRVYNNDFSVQRNGTDVIMHGDRIIVADKISGAFATYTAQVGYISFVIDSKGSAFGDGTPVTAKAGKTEDDISLEISGNPYAISPFISYSERGYTYYLISANFIPNNDLAAVSLCSNTQTSIHLTANSGWKAGQWNNVTFVYDSVGGTGYSYINGELCGTSPVSISDNKLGIAFDTSSSTQKLYIDDYIFEVYSTNPTVPSVIVPPLGIVENGNLTTADDVKVSDLKVQNTNLTVFEDNTYGIVMSDDELLFGNNMAVYVNNRNMYSYYNIINNNLKIWGETSVDATYDYSTETIIVSGQLKHVGDLQMNLHHNGSVVHSQTISSNDTGGVNSTITIGAELINKHLICTLSYRDYTNSIEISTVKGDDLSTRVATINSAMTVSELAASLPAIALELGLEDGTTKDNSYMSNLIFAFKPQSGFDNDSFLTAYEIAEGLAKLEQESINLTQFFTTYKNVLVTDYMTQYNAMSDEIKSDLAVLFTNQLDTEPTFAEFFENAKWFSSYRTADSAVTTQILFNGYVQENSVSMAQYNTIANDYYEQKVFEKMYAVRANIVTKSDLVQSFNTAVAATIVEMNVAQQQQQQQQGSHSGGGGLPSYAITTVEPQVIPGIVLPVFNDVSKHWAKDYIEKLAQSEIINGFEDGSFRPDARITRAEFSKILAAVFGITNSGNKIFADVDESNWFYNPVTALAECGIITGYDGIFVPYRDITRQDMAVMIYRALKLAGDESKAVGSLPYTDAYEASDYAVEAINILTQLQILTGSDGFFNPINSATRAEATAIFSRVLDYLG